VQIFSRAAHGIKQGGLAAQQADVAAQVIAARAGADLTPRPYRPVLRGVLLCGDEVRHLRHDPSGGAGASEEPLGSPPYKVAGRHLANYLSAHPDLGAPADGVPVPA
jgi:sulfide:quinone oxidoreductase